MKNDVSDNIGRFINSNLETVSKNKLFNDVSQRFHTIQSTVKSAVQTTENGMKKRGFIYIKYIFGISIFIFLCLVLWYYIHKYFPLWKIKITNFFKMQYSYLKTKIKTTKENKPDKTVITSKPVKPEKSNENLLTKAQMNNFNHKEKETSEPKPYKHENTIFETTNNLNSNEILNYLLDAETPEEWCYIGESDEKRYCTISQGNKCMSGNLFPTKDLCVNPKLAMQS